MRCTVIELRLKKNFFDRTLQIYFFAAEKLIRFKIFELIPKSNVFQKLLKVNIVKFTKAVVFQVWKIFLFANKIILGNFSFVLQFLRS